MTCECGKISKIFKRDISLFAGTCLGNIIFMFFWLDVVFKIMYLKCNEVSFLYLKIGSKIGANVFKYLHYEPRWYLFMWKRISRSLDWYSHFITAWCSFQNSVWGSIFLTEVFHESYQSVQANSEMLPRVTQPPFSCESSPNHNTPIILLFQVIVL